MEVPQVIEQQWHLYPALQELLVLRERGQQQAERLEKAFKKRTNPHFDDADEVEVETGDRAEARAQQLSKRFRWVNRESSHPWMLQLSADQSPQIRPRH